MLATPERLAAFDTMDAFDPTQLRTIRKARHLTAAELAKRLNISPAQIHRLENGHRRLTVDSLIAYCDAVNVSVGSLFQANSLVPITGTINSEFHIEPVPAGSSTTTVAPPLSPDMRAVAALRWAASGRFEPMRDHIVFYQRNATAVHTVASQASDRLITWNARCLVTRADGSQSVGWPIEDGDHAHIDFGNGPVEFRVEIVRADPVIAVMPPLAVAHLEQLGEPLAP